MTKAERARLSLHGTYAERWAEHRDRNREQGKTREQYTLSWTRRWADKLAQQEDASLETLERMGVPPLHREIILAEYLAFQEDVDMSRDEPPTRTLGGVEIPRVDQLRLRAAWTAAREAQAKLSQED